MGPRVWTIQHEGDFTMDIQGFFDDIVAFFEELFSSIISFFEDLFGGGDDD
jgi:hypothetical protein